MAFIDFDLALALSGAKIKTKSGKSAKIAGHNKEAIKGQELAVWVDGILKCYSERGESYLDDGDDLVICADSRSGWMNIYPDPWHPRVGGNIHGKREDAEQEGGGDQKATVYVTWIEVITESEKYQPPVMMGTLT